VLSLFQTNRLYGYLWVLLFFALLSLPAWIQPPVRLLVPSYDEPLFSFVFHFILSRPLLSLTTGSLIVLGNAVVINQLYNLFGLGKRQHFLTALFFLLTACLKPELLYFNPVAPATLLLTMALRQAFRLYNAVKEDEALFNMGAFIGLAVLFYPPFALLIIWSLAAVNQSKRMSLREWLLYLFGMLTPWWISFGLLYLIDRQSLLLNAFRFFRSFSLPETGPVTWADGAVYILLAILLMLSLASQLLNQGSRVMQTRKYHLLLMLLYPFLLFSVFFASSPGLLPFYPLALPVSITLANYYEKNAGNAYLSALCYLLILLIISKQYLNFDLINYIIP